MTTTYTDEQLKAALARMLPGKLYYEGNVLGWKRYPDDDSCGLHYAKAVLDTELLHLCWLLEEKVFKEQGCVSYYKTLVELCQSDVIAKFWSDARHATWQQRTIALAKVKGVVIV